jgi:hypothetical protein
VERLGRRSGKHNRVMMGKPPKKNYFDDLGVDGNIILKCVLKKQCWEQWIDVGRSGGLL